MSVSHIEKFETITIAANGQRVLLEETISGTILSLHPAFLKPGTAKPISFTEVENVASSPETGICITWKAINGLQAKSAIRSLKPLHSSLEVSFSNLGSTDIAAATLFPIHFPAEGPGACAVGITELRTLVTGRSGKSRLAKLRDEDQVSERFGAWFTPSGLPMVFVGALGIEANSPSRELLPKVSFHGARGKILSLGVECPCEGAVIHAGQTVELPVFAIVVGNVGIVETIAWWKELAGVGDEVVEAFEPSGAIPDVEEEDFAEIEVIAKNNVTESVEEIALEDMSDSDEETGGSDEIGDDADEDTDNDVEGLVDYDELTEEEGALWGEVSRPRRCAFLQRKLRETEGVWPRWGCGRAYLPMTGMAARTKDHWRRGTMKPDSGSKEE